MHNDSLNVRQVVALQFHELMLGSGGQVTYALQSTHFEACLDAFVTSNQLCHDCDQAVAANLDSSRYAGMPGSVHVFIHAVGAGVQHGINAASVVCHVQT